MLGRLLWIGLLVAWAGLWGTPSFAADAVLVGGEGPTARAEKRKKKKDEPTAEEKSEEEKRIEAEEERKRREMLARVVVLKWPGASGADYLDETLRRNVRSRITRSEAMFFPEVDLYQNGRKLPDRTVIAANQPAVVPDANAAQMLRVANEVLSTPWNGYANAADWYLKAQELRQLSDGLWFVDRQELRAPLFMLYAAIGYAASNADNTGAPYFESIGGQTINYYYYQAALLAYGENNLTENLAAYPEPRGVIDAFLGRLRQGSFPSYKLDFEQENFYDPEQFATDYELLINGLPASLDGNARVDLFLGRNDIYLRRLDSGHGLSERLELTKLEAEKAYFVRDVARKRMGIEFIEQLFLNPYACLPDVDGDILNYLAIYQKLHDKADIFIAVAEKGNPNRVFIWQYDRQRAQLKLIEGGADSFPVRFAILFSSGILYNGASTAVDADLSDETSLAPDDVADPRRIDIAKEPATLPFDFELRGHYNRLMVNVGVEWGLNLEKNSKFVEYYQTPGKQNDDNISTVRHDCQLVTEEGGADTDGDGQPDASEYRCEEFSEVFNRRSFSRHLYLGAGVVLGRDAGIGFGPRFALQWGWTNIPHGWMTTGHFGWAIQPKIGDFGGRVRPMIDLDFRGGVAIARPRSLQFDAIAAAEADKENDKPERRVEEVFGATLGVGMTF